MQLFVELRRGPARLLSFLLVAMIISGLAMTAVTPRQVFAAPQGCGVTGEAFAINANVLGLNLAKIAGVTLPPGGSNTAAPLNVNVGLTSLGLSVLPSTSNDTSTQSQASALSTAGVANLGLTNGVTLPIVGSINVLNISADAIAVSANSVATGSGAPTNSGTATVANLKIGGQTLNGAVAPNTKLDLTVSVAGVGLLTVAKVTLVSTHLRMLPSGRRGREFPDLIVLPGSPPAWQSPCLFKHRP